MSNSCFNTQPPEGGWLKGGYYAFNLLKFQHTAARRRLGYICMTVHLLSHVSTHSRPKAAGRPQSRRFMILDGFNTQPPEGGWFLSRAAFEAHADRFNTQPPEGGWAGQTAYQTKRSKFQHTAARRRLAAVRLFWRLRQTVSTHSRPKAAGSEEIVSTLLFTVSTHSRPKAAGSSNAARQTYRLFQHTAARRRLGCVSIFKSTDSVSTHSRPKAAGLSPMMLRLCFSRFNTQPPEGGWADSTPKRAKSRRFQHTAARRRLGTGFQTFAARRGFNTQPPEGGWNNLKIDEKPIPSFNTQPPEGGWLNFI